MIPKRYNMLEKFYKAKTKKQPGTGEEKAEQSKDSKGIYNQGG